MKNNFYKKSISLILLILLLLNNFSLVFSSSNTIYIDSLSDLIDFKENATLDTYYHGKTVILRSDLDISKMENFTIPIFSGTFDGQGYTISGLSINKKGSIQGLFRYLEKDGLIKNLNVSGNISPSGSKDIIGGIVGKNMGKIERSHFKGNIMGKNNIGGIAGINEATGIISHCVSEGSIIGEYFTGGIVGQNLGTILKSTNLSQVNTTLVEISSNIEDVDWSKINSMENVKAQTGTGGIAGYSSGYLQDCMNRGPVGYKDFGYNIGGIVGRQSGYISNCQNYNTIKGRKDIGGIVGQLEPHLILFYSEDTLQKLDKELDTLQNLMNKSFNNSRNSSSKISSQLTNISKSIDDTRDSMKTVSTMSLDHIDEVEDAVNLTTERIRYTLDEMVPILDTGTILSDKLADGLADLEDGFDHLERTSKDLSRAINAGNHATNSLMDAMDSGQRAMRNLRDTVDYIKGIGSDEDILKSFENPPEDIKKSLSILRRSYEDKSQAISVFTRSLQDIEEDETSTYTFGFIDRIKNIIKDFKKLTNNIDDIAGVLSKIENILDSNLANEIDPELYELQNLFKELKLSLRDISHGLTKLEDASDESGKAFNKFSHGFSEFESASNSMEDIMGDLGDLFDVLSSKPDISLPNISSEFRESGENLFDNMEDISSEIKAVYKEVKDGVDIFIDDLERVGDQIHEIFNLLIVSREDIDLSGKVEDISDENLAENSLGALYKNQNYGDVQGIINVGGTAGTMAIEYDLDPEGDILEKGKPSFNFKYTSSAVIKRCINRGNIEAKKDYVGGIAGRMDLGIVSNCENYGDIKSKEGDYVGGIAGISYTKIDKSFCLSSLSGNNYIGGIAGYATDLSNSYALVEFDNGKEWIGSIAGKAEGIITNNYYVKNDVPAIDGISYSGKAAPLSYDELLEIESLPDDFKEFHIAFLVDGDIFQEISFEYGDSFDLANLPVIPKKEGYSSYWQDFKSNNMHGNTTVKAIYTPLKTTLATSILRGEKNLPLLLAEGEFNKDVKLVISPFNISKDDFTDKNALEAWNISLDNIDDQRKSHTIRLLPPETKGDISIWQLKGIRWEKLDSKTHGSYIVFSMNGNHGSFAVVEKGFNWMILIIIISVLLLGFLAIKKSNGRKRRNNKDLEV